MQINIELNTVAKRAVVSSAGLFLLAFLAGLIADFSDKPTPLGVIAVILLVISTLGGGIAMSVAIVQFILGEN